MRLIDADYVIKCIPQEEINARFAVVNAPTIEAEPVKHRHWGIIKNAYGEIEGFIHTECGRESKSKDNYCPNCGAKMDEEVKE